MAGAVKGSDHLRAAEVRAVNKRSIDECAVCVDLLSNVIDYRRVGTLEVKHSASQTSRIKRLIAGRDGNIEFFWRTGDLEQGHIVIDNICPAPNEAGNP